MGDRPILMSAPMVLATLREIEQPGAGKTGTRRLAWRWRDCITAVDEEDGLERIPTPWQKVKPGDRMWVKESWSQQHPLTLQKGRYSLPGQAGIPGPPPVNYRVIYRADGEPLQIWRNRGAGYPYFQLDGPADEIGSKYPTVVSNFTARDGKQTHWTPSTHMPRWASRLTLTVTAVKLEQLQDITEEDALAEGIETDIWDMAPVARRYGTEGWFVGWPRETEPNISVEADEVCRRSFAALWNSLHGPGAWERNPEVVALTFRPELRNIDDKRG